MDGVRRGRRGVTRKTTPDHGEENDGDGVTVTDCDSDRQTGGGVVQKRQKVREEQERAIRGLGS